MAAAPQTLPEGRMFGGRWRIVRCLRAGGMGAVYEVVHRETKAVSALKVMLPELVRSGEMRARFRQEAMVTATIVSDHIVKVFDGGTDVETGAPYIVMERLRGEDLAARIEGGGPLSPDEAVTLLRQAAMALERTHAAGVVHRDLKPANLFVTTRDDGSPCLKVLDYGIAKIIASASQAETTRTVGTPLYMAPEQVTGDGTIAASADLYAFGQIAYTMLVGRPYWSEEHAVSGNVYPLLLAIAAGAKEPASLRAARAGARLPPAFDAWFARATAVPPHERFTSAREAIDELASALGVPMPIVAVLLAPEPSAARAAGTAKDARSTTVVGVTHDTALPAGRPWMWTMGFAAALFAAALALGWSLHGSSAARGGGATPGAPPLASAAPAAARGPAQAQAESPAATVSATTAGATSATSQPADRPAGSASPKAKPAAFAGTAKPEPKAPSPATSDPSDEYRKEKTP